MNGGTTPTLAARTRVGRYVVACALVLAGALWLLAGAPRVCRQEIPATGTTVVPVCAPPSVTDTATVAWLAVVLLLLAPDLSEAGVAGVTLKRAVEEAKADAATARADVAAIRLSVMRLGQEVDVTTTAQNTTVVQSGDAATLETLGRLGLLRGVRSGADRDAVQDTAAPPAPPAETAQALTLIEGVERACAALPEPWRAGTFIGIAGDVTVLAGPDLPTDAVSRLLRAPDGAVARARRGEYAVSPAARGRPAVVAAPVRDGLDTIGAVALVAPPGLDIGGDETAAALELAAAAAVFAPLAKYALSGRATVAAPAGPAPTEEAP